MVNCGKNIFGDENSKMSSIIETFTIPVTEWKTADAGKNTIRIKGVALKGDVVSRNLRHYLTNEVRKATNTFIGKPINIHHNDPNNERTNIGNLTWMDWDETAEILTYEGEITKQPYVDMLRNKSAEIRGVSVQAKFLHNRCPECNTKFFTEESFKGHMWEQHFKKVSAVPHGIIGEAITLVLSPEIPGYDGTTVDLAETARRETLRLLETVIKTEQEKEEYKLTEISKIKATIAVTPRPVIAVGSVKEIVEPPAQKPEIKQVEPVPLPQPPKETPLIVKQQIPQSAIDPTITESIIKPAETLTLKESKINGINEISTKLSLGEPFAEYPNFAACVAANQDKENPEAYCGQIKHETEEILTLKANMKQLTQKINEVIQEQNKPITLTLPEVKTLAPYNDKLIREALAAIPKDDFGWKEIKPFDPTPLQTRIAEAEAKIPPIDDVTWKDQLKEIDAKINKVTETMATQKTEFDNLLDSADKAVKEHFAQNKRDMEADKTKIKDLEEKLKTAETKKLAETQDITTRVENLEDKLKPQFKAHAKTGEANNNPVIVDPMKQKEKS